MSTPTSTPPPPLPQKGDATGGVIPYKNPHALTSYYLGVFSIIPVLGFILGCIAVPLGLSGLRKRKQNAVIRGTAHAWIGIVAGGLSVAVHLVLFALTIYGATRARR
jgi:hypothetical protein